eukprot:CAMPEP_0113496846 /NCGR_PEP_ID=MMETSP0014_2-20120614/30329_1 /TAXON_ID=2857 /ORGANISM="Nitzschia sp." /LENGTH=93 /DNA_ID=CAMNT_0000390775 /DNA_START=205 /DNA_END=486 /DNA_ORIENTATION=- /assembly_acc=CAM_ASM_000159
MIIAVESSKSRDNTASGIAMAAQIKMATNVAMIADMVTARSACFCVISALSQFVLEMTVRYSAMMIPPSKTSRAKIVTMPKSISDDPDMTMIY